MRNKQAATVKNALFKHHIEHRPNQATQVNRRTKHRLCAQFQVTIDALVVWH
ncbi:Uncharacterised protein [Vibrio cholerae]|nr:Uncharacterised protein [Vibrio cholerae]